MELKTNNTKKWRKLFASRDVGTQSANAQEDKDDSSE